MQCKLEPDHSLNDIPKKQIQAAIKPLSYYHQRYDSRNKALAKAYLAGHYTLKEVGQYFGVSYATVSRTVKEIECKM
jgi:DNA-directed RNA polymerase specialized sigma subunit